MIQEQKTDSIEVRVSRNHPAGEPKGFPLPRREGARGRVSVKRITTTAVAVVLTPPSGHHPHPGLPRALTLIPLSPEGEGGEPMRATRAFVYSGKG